MRKVVRTAPAALANPQKSGEHRLNKDNEDKWVVDFYSVALTLQKNKCHWSRNAQDLHGLALHLH